jgi:hypothetical protein
MDRSKFSAIDQSSAASIKVQRHRSKFSGIDQNLVRNEQDLVAANQLRTAAIHLVAT